MKKILFISNYNLSSGGLSGGDRIFIELLKNWKLKAQIGLVASEECIEMLKRYDAIDDIEIFCSAKIKKTGKNICSIPGYIFHTINRTFFGIKSIFQYKKSLNKYKYIYSASDFYPDTIPALILKLLYPKKIWIGSLYLFAPNPWQKDNPYKTSFSRFLTGTFYWLTQKITYFIIYHFADYVYVTSKPDVTKFISAKRKQNKIIIIKGGVDIAPSEIYLKKHPHKYTKKKYTAVFMGRLHYQKGVLELIDIWKIVHKTLPQAKLAIIGDGQLLPDIKRNIAKYKLKNNIDLYGFLDGQTKFKIFNQSLIVVHPATFDSGGMASAEAMAWGLPGVSFDLEALKTYYPKGMIKTKCGDLDSFAKNIIKLSQNSKIYNNYSRQALELIRTQWSWPQKANMIYEKTFL